MNLRLRKIIFWLHLITGVVAGVVILVMSVTGVLITYERQLTAWADGYHIAPPTPGASRLGVESLLVKTQAAQSNAAPSTLILRADPTAPAAIGFGRERTVFVNPYTGEILGEGAKKSRQFFHLMTDWHRWLGTNEKGRAVGKAITGACNLAFLFLVVSGFYLWWPRTWTRASLRAITWFDPKQRGKARDWNWHNVIGFWTAPILFVIVSTGVLMSYPWATNLLYRLTGSEPPPQRAEAGRTSERGRGGNPATPANFSGLDQCWAQAETKTPNWQSITLRFAGAPEAPLTFTIDRSNGGRPDKRSQLTVNRKTGEIIKYETFEGYNLGRRLRSWARFVHTGEAAGPIGQTVALIASAGAAMLVWTGLAMAWRRFFCDRTNSKTDSL